MQLRSWQIAFVGWLIPVIYTLQHPISGGAGGFEAFTIAYFSISGSLATGFLYQRNNILMQKIGAVICLIVGGYSFWNMSGSYIDQFISIPLIIAGIYYFWKRV